jgi:hypothetical protein
MGFMADQLVGGGASARLQQAGKARVTPFPNPDPGLVSARVLLPRVYTASNT